MSGAELAMLIVSQFVGPISGVLIAHTLARKAAKSESMRQLVSKLFTDVQRYRHALAHMLHLTDDKQEFDRMERAYREAETDLNTDALMAVLIFDTKGGGVVAAIHKYIAEAEAFTALFPIPDPNQIDAFSNRHMQAIMNELQKLPQYAREDEI
jgi:hypothetical protein